MEIIKLTPYFSERLWGGHQLSKFGFNLPENKLIGEAWVISALSQGTSYVVDGKYKGQTLANFFDDNKYLFGNDLQFPLLTKIISANDYLSVQVHPDDEYGLAHNQMLGKPECWYVLDAPTDAKIIYGHSAQTKLELTEMVNNQEWDKLFTYVPIKKGDFVYVPPGKIHAITPGVTVYELQRSSDITYRFYDFNRKDKNGQLRPLHLTECLAVTTVPDSTLPIININEGKLIDNEYFTLYLIKSDQYLDLQDVNWFQFTVISGQGKINDIPLVAGESGIIYNLTKKTFLYCQGEILISFKRNI